MKRVNGLDTKQQNEKFIKMTETPIPKLVSTLAVPTIISMLITSFYNMADTFFVGKINTSATGAVGVVFSLMALIQALGFTFGHGSGNYISRKLGSQEFDDAERMASTGFFSALIAGGLLAVFGLIFLEPLVRMLGATDTILPYAMDYARFILLGAPYMTASLVLNNQLRFQGSALYSMVGIASGAVLNIGLDPLFIFVFEMGTGGAALATIISQFVSFCLLWVGCKRGGNVPIRLRNFTPEKRYFVQIFKGGFPSFCRQGIASVATICLNFVAGGYGDAAIAAMSIVNRVAMFASSALIGFGQGFQPVCGFNYGAKLYHRVREAFWFCFKISIAFLAVVALVGYWKAPEIVAMFRRGDAEVLAIGSATMRFQCLTLPLWGWVVLCNMMLQTIGKSFYASVLALARQGLCFLPALFVLVPLLGLPGLEMTQMFADLGSFLIAVPMGLSILREMKYAEQAGAPLR